MLATEYPSADWFRNDKKVDVSIIVPMFKSRKVLQDLVNSWPNQETKYSWEIIFVDDHCPDNSKDSVVNLWKPRGFKQPIGKIIYNAENKGYGLSCNVGAEYALGTYLIFLNADTRVTPNWMDSLVDLMAEDEKVGIVGNMQLKEGGMWNGTIDSAGSEWVWGSEAFVHIGRHTYNRSELPVPMRPESAPEELHKVAEREMVTGCCQGISASLFRSVGGYNANYRVGYWEDSELCMTVKELGYKILFQPNSVIHHKLGHTNSGNHKHQSHNREYFFNKWVHSGRIDKLIGVPRSPLPEVKKILLKRAGAHGDVLVAGAVASALKEKHNCKIVFATSCPEVLKNNPYIDKVIQNKEISYRDISVSYDLDMAYEYRPYTNILTAYANAVGVDPNRCRLYLDTQPPGVELPDDYVVIHPGKTMWAGRDWKKENFAVISTRLRDMGHKVVIVGRGGDESIPNDLDLRGKTTISQLAYVISKAKFFIGIDSFPMHVAQTFDTPGVCFFGSVDPASRILSPKMTSIIAKNLSCLGCHHRKPTPCTVTNSCLTGTLDCINLVSVDDMWSNIMMHLNLS